MSRRLRIFLLAGAVATIGGVYFGARARAADAPARSTKRHVKLALVEDDVEPRVVVRLEIDQPAKIVTALPAAPPRIVRVQIDDAPPEVPHLRMVHDDLDQTTTFSVGEPGETTARHVRTEL